MISEAKVCLSAIDKIASFTLLQLSTIGMSQLIIYGCYITKYKATTVYDEVCAILGMGEGKAIKDITVNCTCIHNYIDIVFPSMELCRSINNSSLQNFCLELWKDLSNISLSFG